MVWVRLDDHFDENPKIASVGPLGLALWVTGLAYCNRNLTDGFIPWATAYSLLSWQYLDATETDGRRKIRKIGSTCGMAGMDVDSEHVITLLLDAGLWDELDNGFQIHDYGEFQPLKAGVLAERAAKQAAGRAGGQASAQARAKPGAQARAKPGAQAESKPVPVPVPVPNPDPEPSGSNEPVVGAKAPRTPKKFTPLSSEERERLLEEFPYAGAPEQIELALAHESHKKYPTGQYLYVRNWLKRTNWDQLWAEREPVSVNKFKESRIAAAAQAWKERNQ